MTPQQLNKIASYRRFKEHLQYLLEGAKTPFKTVWDVPTRIRYYGAVYPRNRKAYILDHGLKTLGATGTLGLGSYGAYRAGKALMRRLQPVEQDAEKTVLAHYGLHKLASGPESNVHKDVGTYRFNRAAESNDIDDSKQYVFKAHDRRPQVTGDESGQGITFQEGVSG